jgi:hypothetical protein
MRSALENLSGPGKPLSPEPPDDAEIDVSAIACTARGRLDV